jgi:hypothetical protein
MYQNDERVSAFNRLLELRDKLDPGSENSLIEGDLDTAEIKYRIDRVLDQLRPHVRIVARDFRGITVSVYGELASYTDDIYGPDISEHQVTPSVCGYDETVNITATADDRWNGNSTIALVEYFLSESQPAAEQYGLGTVMSPVDGTLDESLEELEANFSSNILNPGSNNIWIHGKDSNDNWGSFQLLEVTLVPDTILHVQDLSMEGFFDYWWFFRRNWARATVTIVDGQGNPVEDARVDGVWSGDVELEDWRMTGGDGKCIFESPQIWGDTTSTYTFTVDNVSKTGYVWDGIIVSDTLLYP